MGVTSRELCIHSRPRRRCSIRCRRRRNGHCPSIGGGSVGCGFVGFPYVHAQAPCPLLSQTISARKSCRSTFRPVWGLNPGYALTCGFCYEDDCAVERAEHRPNLNVCPFATPSRSHVALVELRGNGVVACNASPLDLLDNWQHIGRKLPRISLYSGRAGRAQTHALGSPTRHRIVGSFQPRWRCCCERI
jgi:hypothetical protein